MNRLIMAGFFMTGFCSGRILHCTLQITSVLLVLIAGLAAGFEKSVSILIVAFEMGTNYRIRP